MACAAVLRKRASSELSFDPAAAPPLKRARSSTLNMRDVLSVFTQLTRSASGSKPNQQTSGLGLDHHQASGFNVGLADQASTSGSIGAQASVVSLPVAIPLVLIGKRKRGNDDPITERPLKRQRTDSRSEQDDRAQEDSAEAPKPAEAEGAQLFCDEVMETDAEAVTSGCGEALTKTAKEGPDANEAPSGEENMQTHAVADEEPLTGEELLGAVGGVPAAIPGGSGEPDAQFEADIELICEIHPTIDPVYIREQLLLLINDPQRVSTVTFDLYSLENPPMREHRETLEVVQREYERLNSMTFDLEQFLNKYPDPEATFNVRDTEVTEIYYDYAEVFLKNYFKQLGVNYIRNVLQRSGFHLTPAFNILKDDEQRFESFRGDRRKKYFKQKYRLYPRSEEYEDPKDRDVIDDDFFWERMYVLNQDVILGHLAAEKAAKEQRLEQARLEGRLHECDICMNSEVLQEDTTCCFEGHRFCSDCVRRSAEELLGQGRATFPCLNPECKAHYPLATLERILKASTFDLVVRRVQSEELRLAEIEHLVSCPFCPFAVVIPDGVSSNVFHCENPACMEDSCRLCRKTAHIPYSCEEFDTMTKNQFERFMENQMAEAMIRNCPKCNLRFFKEEGCNHMTCSSCRTSICYVCKADITKEGYKHFHKNKECSQVRDMATLHRNEIVTGFNSAEERYRQAYPDLLKSNNIVLAGYNPLETLNI